MLDFERETKNDDGNDGYIWSKRISMVWSVSLSLALAMIISGSRVACGGFIGWGG